MSAEIVDHQEDFKASEIEPGKTVTIFVHPRQGLNECLFRVEKALPVDGIDYEAFQVENVMVNHVYQYKKPRAVKDLFDKVRLHEDLYIDDKRRAREVIWFDVCEKSFGITLWVTNKSDRPLPFAIRFLGKAVY